MYGRPPTQAEKSCPVYQLALAGAAKLRRVYRPAQAVAEKTRGVYWPRSSRAEKTHRPYRPRPSLAEKTRGLYQAPGSCGLSAVQRAQFLGHNCRFLVQTPVFLGIIGCCPPHSAWLSAAHRQRTVHSARFFGSRRRQTVRSVAFLGKGSARSPRLAQGATPSPPLTSVRNERARGAVCPAGRILVQSRPCRRRPPRPSRPRFQHCGQGARAARRAAPAVP